MISAVFSSYDVDRIATVVGVEQQLGDWINYDALW